MSGSTLPYQMNQIHVDGMVYLSTYANPLYPTSGLRQILYTIHTTYQHVVLQLYIDLGPQGPTTPQPVIAAALDPEIVLNFNLTLNKYKSKQLAYVRYCSRQKFSILGDVAYRRCNITMSRCQLPQPIAIDWKEWILRHSGNRLYKYLSSF